jgi:hypothetical protein
MTVPEVFRQIRSHPGELLIRRWNWKSAAFSSMLRRDLLRYRSLHGTGLDLSRAWWTPPLAPYHAWLLETRRIENHFGMRALVSLTDHDDIQAPLALRVLEECRDTPVSVEWTVPYENTFFHFGVHNIPAERARETMQALAAFTSAPSAARVRELFASLAEDPATLIVFNHPNWDEKGIGADAHRALARQFVAAYTPFIHAFELNGLRPWKENRTVFGLAKRFDKPLISGGDRHALEPNVILNLTNASSFPEFVDRFATGTATSLSRANTGSHMDCESCRVSRTFLPIRRITPWDGGIGASVCSTTARTMSSDLWPNFGPSALPLRCGSSWEVSTCCGIPTSRWRFAWPLRDGRRLLRERPPRRVL